MISGGQPRPRGWPGRRSGPRHRLGVEPVAVEQPRELGFMIDIDHDHHVESVLLTGLHQQRDDVHDHGVRRPRPAPARRPGRGRPDGRSARDLDGPPGRRRRSCPGQRDPAGRRVSTSLPNRSTTAARPGVPGSTTSRASTSASITTAPYAQPAHRRPALLPEAIPPVSPTAARRGTLPLARERQRRSPRRSQDACRTAPARQSVRGPRTDVRT